MTEFAESMGDFEPTEMRRLSSAWTFYQKIIWPTFLLAYMAIFPIISLFILDQPEFLIFALGAWAACFWTMFRLRFQFVDQLWVVGDTILVRNRGSYDRFPASNIAAATFIPNTPTYIHLRLTEPCKFGKALRFMPLLVDLTHRGDHPIAVELRRLSRGQQPTPLDPAMFQEPQVAIQVLPDHLPWDGFKS